MKVKDLTKKMGGGVIISALHALENLTFILLMATLNFETFGGKVLEMCKAAKENGVKK